VIPGLLKRWYAERKEMQAKLKECKAKEDEEYFLGQATVGQED
jgi:hypothetical protein